MDEVKHPSHYTQGPIECIDALYSMVGKDAFIAHCQCVAVKYIWRLNRKDEPGSNLGKARQYLSFIENVQADRFPSGAENKQLELPF